MKKLFTLIIGASIAITSVAQEDDVYFVPTKKTKETQKTQDAPSYIYDSNQSIEQNTFDYDNWAEGQYFSDEEIDKYNRMNVSEESAVYDSVQLSEEKYANESADGTYTSRLVRFHSPRLGVYVSSPYYVDYYDLWYTPWYYDPFYYSPYWYGYGWYRYPWYGYHSCWDWCYGWGPIWGCGYYPNYWWGHHHHHHHHHYKPLYASGKIGPRGGWVDRYRSNKTDKYVSNGRTQNGRANRNGNYSTNYRPSRDYGKTTTTTRPSRNTENTNRYNGTSRSNRQFGNQNGSNSTTTTRRNSTTTTTRETRTNNRTNSSRSYNSTSSRSTTRSSFSTGSTSRSSYGVGSSRGFGGGGGSRGGRR